MEPSQRRRCDPVGTRSRWWEVALVKAPVTVTSRRQPSGGLSPSNREMRRAALILILVAVAAALIPAWRSIRIRILDAIWG
jgi:hypothetical protein